LREGRSGGSHFNATAAAGFGRNELRPSRLSFVYITGDDEDAPKQTNPINVKTTVK
jgi:hypothetical protein